MACASKMFIFPLAFLLLQLNEHQYCVVPYNGPLVYGSKRNFSSKLCSSRNNFSSLTSIKSSQTDNNNFHTSERNGSIDKLENEKDEQKKIEFADFWGSKLTSYDATETGESTDRRHVPFVPTLDLRDGPLPVGAYIMEGKSEFDAKTTCRISLDVNERNFGKADDPDAVVRYLQTCLDAGFDTFQLHDQTSRSLDIIRRMNENTPTYVNTHWSVSLKIKSRTKLDLRQAVLNIIEQTGSDALDSLKIDFGRLDSTQSTALGNIVLDEFDYLVDLQREGWIRSFGIQNFEEQKVRHEVMTYFGEYIDFEERSGSLLSPPILPDYFSTISNVRLANALGDGLLTDLFSKTRRQRTFTDPQPELTTKKAQLLNVWAKRHKRNPQSTSNTDSLWDQYQEHVVGQLIWIAMKYDVPISAVALRWALECGCNAMNTNGEVPIVSSAIADIVFEDENDDIAQQLTDVRQIFRFQLDEEDRHILSQISATEYYGSQSDEEENPAIDFNNPALWL